MEEEWKGAPGVPGIKKRQNEHSKKWWQQWQWDKLRSKDEKLPHNKKKFVQQSLSFVLDSQQYDYKLREAKRREMHALCLGGIRWCSMKKNAVTDHKYSCENNG